jgi:hypothetical protein
LSEDDFYTPTDLEKLRMENELLAFEVRFLRARLGWSGKGPGSSVSLNRLARLEEAETDLALLVGRMAKSPLGPLLRLRRSFRTLEKRYVLSPVNPETSSQEERLAYLELAEKDLVLLLRRMGSRPLGPLFRRKREFVTLEQRYL